MGFMDSVKGLVNKGKDYASKNPDKADQFIEKVGDQVDGRTGGKYTQHVDKAQDAARQLEATQRSRVKAMVGRGREFTDEEMDMVMASPAAAQILHMISYTGAGTPDTVVDYLHRFAEHADADELMISPTATRQPDVLTAMELLADNWN